MNEKQIAANPHESLNEDGPPFEISSGPTAGHEHREVIDGECGNCGFDRLLLSQKNGEATQRCLLCNSYNHASVDDEWQTERTTFDELKQLREWADDDSNVEKIGEYGRTSRYFHGTEVFEHVDTDLLKIFEHPSSTETERKTFKRSELRALLRLLEREDGFVTDFVAKELDDRAITNSANAPNNPNAIHAGVVEHRGITAWLWINMDHLADEFEIVSPLSPIHFDPQSDGIAI